jgi:hypothetical protein
MTSKRDPLPASAALLPAPREGERTEPLAFVIESFSVYVEGKDGETSWAAEVKWDEDDGCFVLEDVHNYTLAPCDLLELARFLRVVPRELATSRPAVGARARTAADGGSSK